MLTEKITKAIKEVGVAGGYLYIFDVASGIPYISETLSTDVTGAVKAKLGIQYLEVNQWLSWLCPPRGVCCEAERNEESLSVIGEIFRFVPMIKLFAR